MDPGRPRLCVCFLLTVIFVSISIYGIVKLNVDNMHEIRKLRTELEQLAHAALHKTSAQQQQQQKKEAKPMKEVVKEIIDCRMAQLAQELHLLGMELEHLDLHRQHTRRKSEEVAAANTALDVRRINFASEDLGAKIESVEARALHVNPFAQGLLNMDFCSNPPINVLKTSMQPGNCYAFAGSTSTLTIKLAATIYIEGFELEHIPRRMSPSGELSSAPRSFAVSGLATTSCPQQAEEQPLGSFEYIVNTNNMRQYFAVQAVHERFQYVRFEFLENHGHPNYTCVYNIAVYGRLN